MAAAAADPIPETVSETKPEEPTHNPEIKKMDLDHGPGPELQNMDLDDGPEAQNMDSDDKSPDAEEPKPSTSKEDSKEPEENPFECNICSFIDRYPTHVVEDL